MLVNHHGVEVLVVPRWPMSQVQVALPVPPRMQARSLRDQQLEYLSCPQGMVSVLCAELLEMLV